MGEIRNIMKKFILAVLLIFICSASYAENVLTYRTYLKKTQETTDNFYITIGDMKDNKRVIIWNKEEEGINITEEYVLDKDYATLSWKVKTSDGLTDYVGVRRQGELYLKGKFNGVGIDKKIEIDEKPFYFNPKLGLMGFVASGERSAEFWGMRNDQLTVFLMKARNKGVKNIKVNGRDEKAIKVYWALSRLSQLFFKRNYWFRESDGLYIKQETSGGKLRELIDEK